MFTSAVLKFLLNPRVIAAFAIFILVGGSYFYVSGLQNKIQKLEADKLLLETNNQTLKDNVETMRENVKILAEANHENWKTAQALLQERAEAQKAINNLSVAAKNDRAVIVKLNNKLNEIIKDPKNDGIVSPALRETVRDVQDTRRRQ
jgi:tRNA A37 N6-isopentenylltransferase MiaA